MESNQIYSVLLIDDDINFNTSIKEFLEDNEFNVTMAENGRIGFEIFQRENPDIILLDLNMPEVDGWQTLANIRESSKNIPIIVISGTGDLDDVLEALRKGAWDYLMKPIDDLKILLLAIDRVL